MPLCSLVLEYNRAHDVSRKLQHKPRPADTEYRVSVVVSLCCCQGYAGCTGDNHLSTRACGCHIWCDCQNICKLQIMYMQFSFGQNDSTLKALNYFREKISQPQLSSGKILKTVDPFKTARARHSELCFQPS